LVVSPGEGHQGGNFQDDRSAIESVYTILGVDSRFILFLAGGGAYEKIERTGTSFFAVSPIMRIHVRRAPS
jgi:hypothetical protein